VPYLCDPGSYRLAQGAHVDLAMLHAVVEDHHHGLDVHNRSAGLCCHIDHVGHGLEDALHQAAQVVATLVAASQAEWARRVQAYLLSRAEACSYHQGGAVQTTWKVPVCFQKVSKVPSLAGMALLPVNHAASLLAGEVRDPWQVAPVS